jgi:chromosome segregation ATPase
MSERELLLTVLENQARIEGKLDMTQGDLQSIRDQVNQELADLDTVKTTEAALKTGVETLITNGKATQAQLDQLLATPTLAPEVAAKLQAIRDGTAAALTTVQQTLAEVTAAITPPPPQAA